MSRNSEIITKPISSIFGRGKEDLKRIAEQEHNIFSYATLAVATDNFADSCKVVQGGYGSVYKGILKDGTKVAVMMLSETSQRTKEFVNEAEPMISLQHSKGVKLLGYCADGKRNFVVYEFVPNVDIGKLLRGLFVEENRVYPLKSKTISWNSWVSKLINEKEDLKRIAAQERKVFSYPTLAAATDNFANYRMLGEGGYGSVYKGILKDGIMVAVKMLSETSQGMKEFVNEAELMISLQHRNVVKLLGYCVHGKRKFLVSEFVPNNNLGKHLSDSNSRRQLNWARRYAIIQGITYGLLYLHGQQSRRSIIHRDIKLENILIDENWEPKIADFGLSRILKPNQSHIKTKLFGGTRGYIAPELCFNPNATPKTDIYSFGVTILEIISGQKISGSYSANGSSLVDQAYDLQFRRLEFMDRTLEASAVIEEVEKCIAIGLLCTQGDPRSRPNMKEVMLMLENQGSIVRTIGEPGLRGYNDRFGVKPLNFDPILRKSWLNQDANYPELEITDQRKGILLNSSQRGDSSTSSLSSHVQADNDEEGKVPDTISSGVSVDQEHKQSKIMKKIWNPINSILGREGHEELKKIDAELLKKFSYKTLLDATVGFADNRKISGGSGCVYKGELKDGRNVAVKVLSKYSSQGMEEFVKEATSMSSLQHRNVVKLLGYCVHKDKRLLVYEFVSNNSLAQLLFGKDFNSRQQLDWPRRYGIIQGIAQGLRYLHRHSRKSIIHGDIKPHNILIDEQWKSKITDFSLSWILQPKQTEISLERVIGTCGYMAPELCIRHIATHKGDIYGFGVTILEIISGKRRSEFFWDHLRDIFDQAAELYKENTNLDFMDRQAYKLYQEGRSLEFMDCALEASAVTEEVEKCIAIGLLCVQDDPESRPDMKDVVFMLENQGPVERTIGRPGIRGYVDPTRL